MEQSPGAVEHTRGAVFELYRLPAGDGILVAALDDEGRTIGTVTDDLPRLLNCMNSGWAFVAQVVTVNYGVHSVRVRSASLDNVLAATYTAEGRAIAGSITILDDDDVPARLDVGGAAIVLDEVAELRSLVRSGVPFLGVVDDVGVVSIELAEQ